MPRKRICIIAFKPVSRTIHVLRQIHHLARQYDLTVIGYGDPDPDWPPLNYCSVPEPTPISRIAKLLWYMMGRIYPPVYSSWYWRERRHTMAYRLALTSGADAFHANDWQSLPVAIEAARVTGGRVVFHMHEYAEEERSNELVWRALIQPAVRFLIAKYVRSPAASVDASITVCEPIAARYRDELGLAPLVVLNAPDTLTGPPLDLTAVTERVRMIHHGYAKRGRGLHKLIQVVAQADRRFTLDFMLMPDDRGYIEELEATAHRLAPGRVNFRDPVAPRDIVRSVSEYDLGLCVIEPTTYNNLMMLPNKLFEYIQAGLAICVGPSPAMAQLVRQFGVGVVAPSFDPHVVAQTLSRLTAHDLVAMRQAARAAAAVLNAEVEMGKITALYQQLFDSPEGTPRSAVRYVPANRQALKVRL